MDERRMRFVFYARPHLSPLPQERKSPLADSDFADDRPANSVARIFKHTENDSPSPWGEGRDEGGREQRTNDGRLQRPCQPLKPTHLAPGDENCRRQNHFGMDDAGEVPCEKQILADN